MAFFDINPRYRDILERHQLLDATRLQALPGVVICGHPNRHVVELTIGQGGEAIHCFLKREHRTFWHQRLTNAWAGFGFVTHSRREARLLEELQRAGVPCAEWIAAGEDPQGRSFLLLRAVAGATGLRTILDAARHRDPAWRRALVTRLASALAHIHDAGFHHRDLYAKHIVVDRSENFCCLDWQRSLRRGHVGWRQRWRDLAALHASLSEELASPRERLACLYIYLRFVMPFRAPRAFRRQAVSAIERESRRLLRRRKVREQRQTSVVIGAQRLIWLDGEALCVTPEFYAVVGQKLASWLPPSDPPIRGGVHHRIVRVPGFAQANLVCRRSANVLGWLGSWLPGKSFSSPELRQLALLFRLQRHGINTPRFLAFGQKRPRPWQIASFLLTEPPHSAQPLLECLAELGRNVPQGRNQAWRLLRESALLLRRLHQAGCIFDAGQLAKRLVVQDGGSVALNDMASVEAGAPPSAPRVARDLLAFWQSLPRDVRRPSEAARFLRAYQNGQSPENSGKRLALQLMLSRRAA